ncbi:MAG: hypothetical protein DDT36_00928 [Firmicutes bacterium]|nr:hypothetical protein [Bacillota bacterium]
MWEKLKSLTLLGLILTSFYLTGELWLVHYSPPTPGQQQGEYREPHPLAIMMPTAIKIHFTTESRAYSPGETGFSETWDFLRGMISGGHMVSVRSITERDWLRAYALGSIELKLAGPVQMRMWLEALSVQPSGLSTDHRMDRVMTSIHSNHVYFWDTERGVFLAWENAARQDQPSRVRDLTSQHLLAAFTNWPGQEVRLLAPNLRARAAAWVYVPALPGLWPQLLARHERGQNNQLIAGFFPDWSLVRRVVQRDGRVAFTDGQRHAYLHPDGAVRYVATSWFHPLHDINARASLILASALSFVARHGGWPAEVRMSYMGVEHPPGGLAQINFSFVPYVSFTLQGRSEFVPVVARERQISLTANERHVSDYERLVYLPIDVGASPTRIITPEAAVRAVEQNLLPGSLITDIYIGFYQRPIDAAAEFLFPVWVIKQGRQMFLVNAYTGEIVSR